MKVPMVSGEEGFRVVVRVCFRSLSGCFHDWALRQSSTLDELICSTLKQK